SSSCHPHHRLRPSTLRPPRRAPDPRSRSGIWISPGGTEIEASYRSWIVSPLCETAPPIARVTGHDNVVIKTTLSVLSQIRLDCKKRFCGGLAAAGPGQGGSP